MSIMVSRTVVEAYGVSDSDKCQCGCYRNVVHCPDCSSTQCYIVRSAAPSVLLPNEDRPTEVRGFRCKLCGNTFAESDCVNACKAQVRSRRQAEQTLSSQVKVDPRVEGMTREQRLAFAKSLLLGKGKVK